MDESIFKIVRTQDLLNHQHSIAVEYSTPKKMFSINHLYSAPNPALVGDVCWRILCREHSLGSKTASGTILEFSEAVERYSLSDNGEKVNLLANANNIDEKTNDDKQTYILGANNFLDIYTLGFSLERFFSYYTDTSGTDLLENHSYGRGALDCFKFLESWSPDKMVKSIREEKSTDRTFRIFRNFERIISGSPVPQPELLI